MKGDVRNSVIESCYAHDVDSSAIFLSGPDSGSAGPSNSVVRYCVLQTADNNGVIRFYGPGSKSVDIVGNIVLPNEALGGLSFSGNTGTLTTRVYNNTFYNAYVNIGNPSSTGTLEFRNNLIYELDDTPLTDAGRDITAHSNNLFFRVSGSTRARIGSTNYGTNALLNWEPTAKTTNPQLVDTGSPPSGFTEPYGALPVLTPNRDGLSLQTTSPARSAGGILGTQFNGSVNGRTRPSSAAWDIGAYQVSGDPMLAAPTGLRVLD
jgi:hypothetical protein